MPRFFFDPDSGVGRVIDIQGVDCASIAEAEQQALQMMPLIISKRRTERTTMASIIIRDACGIDQVELTVVLSARRVTPAPRSSLDY